MKKVMYVALLIILGSAFNAYTGENKMDAPLTHSKDFDKMKELVGVWEGKSDRGKGRSSSRSPMN